MSLRPIEIAYGQHGASLYVVIFHPDGRVLNTQTLAWENFNGAHWASNYAVSVDEVSSIGFYRAEYPAIVGLDVVPTEVAFAQQGASPAIGDVVIGSGQAQASSAQFLPDNFYASVGTIVRGAVVTGTNTVTQMKTNLASSLTGAYVGRSVIWITGSLINSASTIIGYDGTTKVMRFTKMPVAPSVGDVFIIV